MYKIKKLKKVKKENITTPPKFRSKREELLWYKKQRMKAKLLPIKSVSIQYKDIQQMLYEDDPRLVKFAMGIDFSQIDDLDKYMQISRFKDGCEIIVFLIIDSYWLINQEELDNKTSSELEEECFMLEQKINFLKQQKTKSAYNRLILLQHRLNTILEYLNKNKTLIL